MNTTATAKKGWAKNETKHCKKRVSPISPSDPQASKNTAAAAPLQKIYERSDFIIGV